MMLVEPGEEINRGVANPAVRQPHCILLISSRFFSWGKMEALSLLELWSFGWSLQQYRLKLFSLPLLLPRSTESPRGRSRTVSQTDQEKKMHHQIENLAKNINRQITKEKNQMADARGGNGHRLQY